MNSSISKIYRFMMLGEQTMDLGSYRGTPVFRVLDWIIDNQLRVQGLRQTLKAILQPELAHKIWVTASEVEFLKKFMQGQNISPQYMKHALDFLDEYMEHLERENGNAYDRGSSDAYYHRSAEPHKWPEGTGKGKMLRLQKGSEEWYQYMLGYIHEEDRKDYGDFGSESEG